MTDAEKDEIGTSTDDVQVPQPKRRPVKKRVLPEILDQDEDEPQVVEGPTVLFVSAAAFLKEMVKAELEKADKRVKSKEKVCRFLYIVRICLLNFS
jgi:hypothetical protein